jgi:ABC-type bacteriocin/lantibiotic exporter with double-glycine peptidase domain
LYSAVTVFAAYSAHITNRLNSFFSDTYSALLGAIFLLVLSICILLLASSLVTVFIAMAALRFAWGWLSATSTPELNMAIPRDDMRATIMSVQSLISGLLSVAALSAFATTGLSSHAILYVLAICAVATGAIAILSLKRRSKAGEHDAL